MDPDWLKSIVRITSSDPDKDDFGTGFVIHRTGQAAYLLTCAHVVDAVGGPEKIMVGHSPAKVAASGSEKGVDLAVLHIEELLSIGRPLLLRATGEKGKPFRMAGFHLFEPRYRVFLIRELHGVFGEQVEIEMRDRINRFKAWDLEISATDQIQRGYSGSPVVDEASGYVMGVASYRQGEGRKGLATSVEVLEKIWSFPSPPPLPGPTDLALAAIEWERQFAENGYTGSRLEPSLLLIEGSIPVVLSSPHAVKHPRRGSLEAAEMYTGALAVQLASLTKASALIYAHTSEEDPAYDTDGEYKRRLRDLVRQNQARFVLDIHGLGQRRPMQIAVGTGGRDRRGRDHKNLLGRLDLLNVLENVLKKAGITNIVVDDPELMASGSNTIGSFTSKELGIPALQIEVHKDYRDPRKQPLEYIKMLHTLGEAIRAIAERL